MPDSTPLRCWRHAHCGLSVAAVSARAQHTQQAQRAQELQEMEQHADCNVRDHHAAGLATWQTSVMARITSHV